MKKIIVIFMLILLSSCGSKDDKTKGIRLKVEVIRVKKQVIEEKIYSVGTISYIDKVEITSKVLGKVEKVYVDIGSPVSKDQILLQVEKFPLELEIKKAEAELQSAQSSLTLSQEKYKEALKRIEQQINIIEKATADLNDKQMAYENMQKVVERKKQLIDIGAITQEEYENILTELNGYKTRADLARKELEIQLNGYSDEDIVKNGYQVPADKGERVNILKTINTGIDKADVDMQKAKVKNAEANLDSIKLLLEKSAIRSPISGIVAMRSIEPGERIVGDNPLLVLMNINQVYAILNVVESRINQIKRDNKIELKVDAVPDKPFWGSVYLISPIVDLKTRTVEIRGKFNNPDHWLKPGMFVRGFIYTGKKKEAFFLPHSSLISMQSNTASVFVVMDKNEVYLKKIRFNEELEDYIEVISGLKENDTVVVKGADQLNEGDIVEIEHAGKE